ncbi:MAG: hypothetical protein U0172_14000 [Nitrospiraceae bacterium]
MQGIHIVLACSICRRIKDEQWDGTAGNEWCDFVTYLRRYQAVASDVFLSDVFCPDCTLSYNRLMEYGGVQPADTV